MSEPKDSDESYIPSGTTPEMVLRSLNDYSKELELALPGNWPSALFMKDLRDYPVESKRILVKMVQRSLHEKLDYLDFFQLSRGKARPNSNQEKEIWDIFSQGSLMLYFESLFLELIADRQHETREEEKIILAYLKALSQVPVPHWNQILEGIGACCYQYFGKEPWLYARLIKRKNADIPEEMTDNELLEALKEKLSPRTYQNRISLEDSRTALIQKFKIT
jgi:hypothetical protein